MSKENTLRILENFANQCRDACKMGSDLKIPQNINCLAILGMGGSSLPGEIIKNCVDLPFPLVVIRDYTLPSYVNSSSQAFAVSYSGNTEEAISAYKEALSRKVPVIGISCGGKLEELCKANKTPHIKVPSSVLTPKGVVSPIQPRDAVGYQTIPILNILHNSGLFPNYKQELEEVFSVLEKDCKSHAKDIAKKLVDKIPIIYSSSKLSSAARIWKISFNENSKVSAYYNEFPEINHNELVGFTQPKGDFYFIILVDEDDHPRVKARIEITKKILEEKCMPVLTIKPESKSKMAKVFEIMYLGKWVSYFLALEYGVDPEEVRLVEDLKKQLDKID